MAASNNFQRFRDTIIFSSSKKSSRARTKNPQSMQNNSCLHCDGSEKKSVKAQMNRKKNRIRKSTKVCFRFIRASFSHNKIHWLFEWGVNLQTAGKRYKSLRLNLSKYAFRYQVAPITWDKLWTLQWDSMSSSHVTVCSSLRANLCTCRCTYACTQSRLLTHTEVNRTCFRQHIIMKGRLVRKADTVAALN